MENDLAEFEQDPRVVRRGLLALAHPLAVTALVLWLLNDHVLKPNVPSPATGKLSDLAGAIVVPLMIAAVLEPVSRHALRIGKAVTAVILSSINVIPEADAAYERILSLIVPSTNTMDVTDLVAVPFVLVSGWIWQRVSAQDRSLRRAWGKALLGVGMVASMATSPDVPLAEQFNGTHFLTEENPSVELAATFQVNGDDGEMDDVAVSLDILALGQSGNDGESPIVVTKEGTGEGTITLALRDPASGPVEVSWRISAEGTVGNCTPACIIDIDRRTPTLTIEAPPDTFGPRPIALVELRDDRPEFFAIEVVLPAGDSDITAWAERVQGRRLVVRHEGADYQIGGLDMSAGEAVSTLLPRPAGCDQGCTLELQLSALPGLRRSAEMAIEFYSAPNEEGVEASATTTRINLESTVAIRDVVLPLPTAVRTDVTIPIAVALPESPQFGDVLRIRPLLGDDVTPFYDIRIGPESTRSVESAPDRCFRGELELRTVALPEDGGVPPANARSQVRVVYRSAEALDAELLVGLGDDAAEIC